MGVRNSKIPEGIELGRNLKPKGDDLTEILAVFVALCAGLLIFSGVVELVCVCQARWPRSPLFAIVGFLSSAVVGLLCMVVGLVCCVVSGDAGFLKSGAGIIADKAWMGSLCPLAFASSLALLAAKILFRSHMGNGVRIMLIAISAGAFVIWSASGVFDDAAVWLRRIVGLTEDLF